MEHAEILSILGNREHVRAVHLVGRATMDFPCQEAHFVIPDLHLFSAERSSLFRYAFDHDKGWPDTGRAALITELLDAFLGRVHVIQLGDLFDVWREDKAAADAVGSTLETYPWASRLLDSSVELLLGNHDHVDQDVAVRSARRALLLEQEQILVIHGDALDPIELLPDPLQKDLVNSILGQRTGSHEMILQGALPVRSEKDVRDVTRDSHVLSPSMGFLLDELGEADAAFCDKLGLPRKQYQIRAVVMGHTHGARVVAKASGSVLMDCGAWVGRCVVDSGGSAEPSAQMAVIGPTPEGSGTDFRVYQLTPE
jgi:UDP-2,3-diacylglucosamine pyrophosphatase LpxH